MFIKIVLLHCFSIGIPVSYGYSENQNWAFHFPAGSNMGLFIALAVPIEVPNENLFVAYNFEANYLLPGNESQIDEYPPLVSDAEEARFNKRIDRNRIYQIIEMKLNLLGHPGKSCLLRTICETATSTFHINGVLGDVIHVILTPSSSLNTDLSKSYMDAENYGNTNGNCRKYNENCSTSFLDIVTWLGKAF